MSTWSLTGVAKESISYWGPGGTPGANNTVGVAVSAPASTWPGDCLAWAIAPA